MMTLPAFTHRQVSRWFCRSHAAHSLAHALGRSSASALPSCDHQSFRTSVSERPFLTASSARRTAARPFSSPCVGRLSALQALPTSSVTVRLRLSRVPRVGHDTFSMQSRYINSTLHARLTVQAANVSSVLAARARQVISDCDPAHLPCPQPPPTCHSGHAPVTATLDGSIGQCLAISQQIALCGRDLIGRVHLV